MSFVGEEHRDNGSGDQLLSENTLGGPLTGRDARLFLSTKTLRQLLDIAESSSIKRVQIDGVGLRVRTWRDKNGHVYETWQLIGQQPKPETHMFFDGGANAGS
tara:strand:+ start:770 stop:1078 length:309 start_codon:yes stop_codon:yes gene_type:complete